MNEKEFKCKGMNPESTNEVKKAPNDLFHWGSYHPYLWVSKIRKLDLINLEKQPIRKEAEE